jgi:hypothetical protein
VNVIRMWDVLKEWPWRLVLVTRHGNDVDVQE